MKKLILGLVVFAAGLFAFTEMFNTTFAIMMTMYTQPLVRFMSVIVTVLTFALTAAGLFVAVKAVKEKECKAEEVIENKDEN